MASERRSSVSHVVYGLRIATNRVLPGLPEALHSQAVDLHIWLKEDTESPATFPGLPSAFIYSSPSLDAHGQPVLRVCILDGGAYFGLFYSDGARFAVERQGREIIADWPENYTLEEASIYLLGAVMGFVLRLRGVTCLHASAVAMDGHAIALLGSPGAGKSTTAAAFANRGFPALSDDVVALEDHGVQFLVHPGYPRLNLWPESVRALFGAEDALPRITPTWEKLYMSLDQVGPRFESKPLPLSAIYFLGERESDLLVPIVEELTGGEALMALIANAYVNHFLDRNMRGQDFDVLGRVAANVPIRRVRPVADPARISDLCNVISTDARKLIGLPSVSVHCGHSRNV